MVNDPFNVLLNSLCYYFIEIFASLFIKVLFLVAPFLALILG